MSIVSADQYQVKLHQVDLDMLNLDSSIRGVAKFGGTVPANELQNWGALKTEWDNFYAKDSQPGIADVFVPFSGTNTLDMWLDRIALWKEKNRVWAQASNNAQAVGIVQALPESPAVVEHRENPPGAPTVIPPWIWMLFGVGALGVVGYTLSSVARLEGR